MHFKKLPFFLLLLSLSEDFDFVHISEILELS